MSEIVQHEWGERDDQFISHPTDEACPICEARSRLSEMEEALGLAADYIELMATALEKVPAGSEATEKASALNRATSLVQELRALSPDTDQP